MNQCPDCGEQMNGDGYNLPVRCPNTLEDWWDCAPDEGPFYCGLTSELDGEGEDA